MRRRSSASVSIHQHIQSFFSLYNNICTEHLEDQRNRSGSRNSESSGLVAQHFYNEDDNIVSVDRGFSNSSIARNPLTSGTTCRSIERRPTRRAAPAIETSSANRRECAEEQWRATELTRNASVSVEQQLAHVLHSTVARARFGSTTASSSHSTHSCELAAAPLVIHTYDGTAVERDALLPRVVLPNLVIVAAEPMPTDAYPDDALDRSSTGLKPQFFRCRNM